MCYQIKEADKNILHSPLNMLINDGLGEDHKMSHNHIK